MLTTSLSIVIFLFFNVNDRKELEETIKSLSSDIQEQNMTQSFYQLMSDIAALQSVKGYLFIFIM